MGRLYSRSPFKDFSAFVRSGHSTVIVEGAVFVGNRIWMSVVTVSPIKLGVDSSECRESKRITSFEGFLSFKNVGVSDKRGSIRRSGAVAHLSG